MTPVDALRRIAYLLERSRQPTFRVRAFRTAAAAVAAMPDGEVQRRDDGGTLTDVSGIGTTTAGVIHEALAGRVPTYLGRLEEDAGQPVASGGAAIRAALRGDLHTHSDWSDGGSPIEEMAMAARELGHEYLALTDHSPRLTVANGLSADRLRRQLDVVAGLNERLAPFRILTGIEVDITEDGGLDQSPDLLDRLDIVVASVHSKLRMPAEDMTRRMITAIANVHTDILGHCTGRLIAGDRGTPVHEGPRRRRMPRPESQFDAEIVFEACRQFDVAVEINSRPERLDPPRRLLDLAVETGCLFSIDTDAHAPGQLDWQPYGCERAEAAAVPIDRIVNSRTAADLLAWARGRA